jgi:glycoprotein-N-acetylgalactosamine 3-beta-galactosyltransferase
MIFTTSSAWSTKARAVRTTWAKRCPHSIFFYSNSAVEANHTIHESADAVALNVSEGYNHLTGKTVSAFRYSLEKYGNEADWFMKADDDT